MGSCASSLCHGAVETWKQSNVLQNEYVIWSRRDKHARAYTVLLNERSKEIMSGSIVTQAGASVRTCASIATRTTSPQPRRGEHFVLADGVTCESMPRAGQRWIDSHVLRGANTRKENIARGMYPIADPVERARLCLSCHFGNSQKFVTHKMMAAGHPRMSFELDTFTQIQPPHYRIDPGQVWDGVRIWAIGQALGGSRAPRYAQ